MITRRYALFASITTLALAGAAAPGAFAQDAEPLKVNAVYSSVIVEPWDGVIHAALEAEAAAGRITHKYQDDIGYDGDIELVLREISEIDQPDIIFGDSFGNEEAVRRVAADFPEIPFVFGSGGGPAEPNFSVFDNWIHEPAYLAGMLAGRLTTSNVIGVVAGYPVPEVNRITNAFIAGAQAQNPDVEVKVTFINSWFDPATAKEAAIAQIGAGADVLYAERFGVIEAAQEAGLLAVGNMADQQDLAPENVITSVTWNMTPTVDYVVDQVLAGSYTSQDLKDFSMVGKGGAVLAPINAAVVAGRPARCAPVVDASPAAEASPEVCTGQDAIDDVLAKEADIKSGLFRVDINESQPAGSETVAAPLIGSTGDAGRVTIGSPEVGGREPAVRLTGITKRFGDLLANDAVDLDVGRGEVHALLGENGAGKTTLMRILYGLTQADSGTIAVDGRIIEVRSPRDAIAAGLGMVTQHFSLVRPMSVAENLALGRSRGIRLDLDAARAHLRDASTRYGMTVDPDARVENLSVGQQQRVEILKALARDCRVLILDEPTAVLVPQEVEALFATLRQLGADGLAVVFISHKLGEVRAISDRVSVLRRGRLVGTVPGSTDERELARMMVGRPTFGVARTDGPAGTDRPPVLRIEGLSAAGAHGLPALRDVSLSIGRGEIVGVAGVSGNGQTELVEVLSGMRRPTSGSVLVADAELVDASPSAVMAAGVGRIPEDRHASLVLDLSVALNLVLEHIEDFRGRGGLDDRKIDAHARELIARFDIKAAPGDRVATLSGGNIQKVLLARVLSRDPRVIVVSQPTRGLDVGATEYVRRELLARRAAGAAILLVSEDLDELLALSDRLIVLYEGRVVGEVGADDADPDRLGMLMAGREHAA